jgi:hypothetical protein
MRALIPSPTSMIRLTLTLIVCATPVAVLAEF